YIRRRLTALHLRSIDGRREKSSDSASFNKRLHILGRPGGADTKPHAHVLQTRQKLHDSRNEWNAFTHDSAKSRLFFFSDRDRFLRRARTKEDRNAIRIDPSEATLERGITQL